MSDLTLSRRRLIGTTAAVAAGAAVLSALPPVVQAADPTPPPKPPKYKGKVTPAERRAAAARAKALRTAAGANVMAPAAMSPGGTPDYFGPVPNWANSPLPAVTGATVTPGTGIAKFVDSLPGLGTPGDTLGRNSLGIYIPVAAADTTSYPGSDYYQIGLKDFSQSLYSTGAGVAGPTSPLRGYYDKGTTGAVPSYLGPLIIAKRDRPTRVKFTNEVAVGALGNLFLPVDTTVMGAGMGVGGAYNQNRATLHLHGGFTPWVSDGTPHQWTVPVGDTALPAFQKGASTQNVPDMPAAGQGEMTFYYTNQQSSRLMFYHDHAYGVTRLNVYAGEAAGYLVWDDIEDGLITANTLPDQGTNAGGTGNKFYRYGIPLIIQDKTFVDQTTIAAQDPTWNWGTTPGTPRTGDLWFPHVYMPNQNPWDMSGATAMGRWDYGPWFWPPFTGITNGPVANTLYDPINAPWEPPSIPGTPNVSIVPEAFMDTPIVNGQAYPYLDVQRQKYRFRILNACNDRFLNLSLFYAADGGGSGAAATATLNPASVSGLVLASGGSGYVDNTYVGLGFLGGGTPSVLATWSATVTGGKITSVALTSPGAGYTSAPTVDLSGIAVDPVAVNPTAAVIAIEYGSSIASIAPVAAGTGYATAPGVNVWGGGGFGAFVTAQITGGAVSGYTIVNPGSGFTTPPNLTIGAATEVKMVPFVSGPTIPASWGFPDGRDGGVPDPTTAGPGIVQIGTEGGFLPAPVELPNQPINYEYNRRNVVVLNVLQKNLFLGPAERADIIIDFGLVPASSVPMNLILYNDAPAPVPAFDPRIDYYTGDPDQTASGGAPQTVPGYGPNTRTVMQFRVAAGGQSGTSNATLMTSLTAAFAATGATKGAFANDQDPIIAPQAPYAGVYGTVYGATPFPGDVSAYCRIQDNFHDYTPLGGSAIRTPLVPKAIQELFEPEYGRMNAILGVEVPNTTGINQTTIPYYYVDPVTEIVSASAAIGAPVGVTPPLAQIQVPNDGTQFWKITHNGVDTHAIHFHLWNVQVINRVGWDGAIRPPDPNELGWKETVRMNPLEDIVVALRATAPILPFGLPDSARLYDPTTSAGSTGQFTGVDTNGNPVNVTNQTSNLGWEYVWHCHLLGHEENDMMRPIRFFVPRRLPDPPVITAPINVVPVGTTSRNATINWTHTPETPAPAVGQYGAANPFSFTIERAPANAAGAATGPFTPRATVPMTPFVTSPTVSYQYVDTGLATTGNYAYRVVANSAAGLARSAVVPILGTPQAVTLPLAPTVLTATLVAGPRINLAWTDGSSNETNFVLERAEGANDFSVVAILPPATGTGSTVKYSDATVVAGVTYSYRVKAVNAAGSSAYRAAASAVGVGSIPGAPTGLTVTAVKTGSKASASLTWIDNSTSETGFTIQRATDSLFTTNLNVTTVNPAPPLTFPVVQTGLDRGIVYWFRVNAFNIGGFSAWSNVFSVLTP